MNKKSRVRWYMSSSKCIDIESIERIRIVRLCKKKLVLMNMKNMKMKKCFDFDNIVGLIDECR